MEVSYHKPSEPHPWDVMGMALPLKPFPTPIPVTLELKREFPEPEGLPPARRILESMGLPNPQPGDNGTRRL
jgi:hypothetical protein